MKVLVTGGAGYLGSVLTGVLLTRGHEVRVVDNFMYNQQSLNHLCHYDTLEIIRADVRYYQKGRWPMEKHIDWAEVIIPLAAIVGASACKSTDSISINYEAIDELVDTSQDNQIIIYPNTNSGYGRSDFECTEESPLTPVSEYGEEKIEAEKLVLKHPRGISLRFATLFGPSPRMRLDLMVNDFVYRALKDYSLTVFEPEFRRNFLHVADAANAIIFMIDRMKGNFPGIHPGVYNCGDSRLNMTKKELAERITVVLGSRITLNLDLLQKDPDQRDYVISNAKIESLGWHPELPDLETGIEELVKCFQQFHHTGRNYNA